MLRDFLASQLGGRLDKLLSDLSDVQSGRRADGHSHFLGVLEGRAGLPIGVAELRRLDLNVMAHEETLSRRRPGFRLLYFQYLAALFTEIFLTRFTAGEAELLLALDDFRALGHYPELPPYTGRELRTLAFWLATGAGKTLLMHLALLQFRHYAETGVGGRRLFTPDAVVLITPNAGLSAQHLTEFAASGIEARSFADVPAGFSGVQVIEISKLRPDDEKARSGGVSVPVGQFAGANLLLVDEGHKGAATASDQKDENRWRTLREKMAGPQGFTLEYSATFAQVVETDKSGGLLHTYGRAVAFEYAYGRFYRDGYGKEFQVLNLRDDADEVLTTRVMLAGLLTLLDKRLAYDRLPEAARLYNLKAPLMVFVGATVNGRDADSDVPVVLRLLDRVLSDPEWATAQIALILAGQSGLQDAGGRDALHGTLTLLRGRDAAGVYAELTGRMFGGSGGLVLQHLRGADGEIALTAATGRQPFGVVNVGDPVKLLKELRGVGLNVAEDDPLGGSLFAGLNAQGSPVNILVGSKKFIEGWSSWRVSVMGLLRVGQNAGAQVMQMFGRGVRLLGLHGGLKRSGALEGDHPPEIAVQETLSLFGIKANYLQVLLDALRQEGLAPTFERELPISISSGWEEAGLQIPTLNEAYTFSEEVVVLNAAGVPPVTLNLSGKLEVGRGDRIEAGASESALHLLAEGWTLIEEDALVAAAQTHKGRRSWHNLYLPRAEVLELARRSRILSRPDFLTPSTPVGLKAVQAAAEEAVTKGIDKFYADAQSRAESEHMSVRLLTRDHPNFPRLAPESGAQGYGYTLKVPAAALNEIDALIADAQALLQDADTEPLPRLHLDRHLYAPLLTDHPGGIKLEVKASPKPLEKSEIDFVHHLRRWWALHHQGAEWQGTELWLLRNLPKTGVGFFQTAGFYPDFLLWLRRGDRQALAFIDPKGVRQMGLGDEKFKLRQTLEGRRAAFGFHVTSFIAAGNLPDAPFVKGRESSNTEAEELERIATEYHILDQDSAGLYVGRMLDGLRVEL